MAVQITISGSILKRVLTALAALALVSLIVLGLCRLLFNDPIGGSVDDDRYQAVILDNERIYFGKLERVGRGYYRLNSAYFIRESTEKGKTSRNVVPLRQELHGPDDSMLINGKHLVLVENLHDDSAVAKAIEDTRDSSS